MNALDSLKELKSELMSALELQQYHGLLDIDARIKQQVSVVMAAHSDASGQSHQADKVDKETIKREFVDLMSIYQRVVSKCQDRSNDLKKSCLELKASKQNTDKYLDVAGRL